MASPGTAVPVSKTRLCPFSPNTGGQTAVSFTSPTDYTFQHETGAVEQGNYEAALDVSRQFGLVE